MLPLNMKESCMTHTVKRHFYHPTSIRFNEWLVEKAETHKSLRANAPKTSNKEDHSHGGDRLNATTRILTSIGTISTLPIKQTTQYPLCKLCKGQHAIWK